MNKFKWVSMLILAAALFPAEVVFACTNFLVTKNASIDGSTMISYAADSHDLYGELYHWKGQEWPDDAMLDIYEWDTGIV